MGKSKHICFFTMIFYNNELCIFEIFSIPNTHTHRDRHTKMILPHSNRKYLTKDFLKLYGYIMQT